jgi:hypothetical protein
VVTGLATHALGQTSAPPPLGIPQRDPQAATLLSQSMAAMIKSGPLRDIKLQAKATRTAGADTDTGTAILEGAAYDQSKASFAFASGPRAEIRNGPAGAWSAADAQNHAIAIHNTWTAAAWFAPSLIVQSWVQDSSFSLVSVGAESRDGSQVQHVRAAHYPSVASASDIASGIARLSIMDLYLDSQSLLPVELTFNTHPDNDLNVDLPVRVTFGGYQTFAGLVAPARIQSFLQNSLLLDISVSATTANNGLGPGDFQLP